MKFPFQILTEQRREQFNKKVFDTDSSLTSDNAVPIRFRGDSSKQSTDNNYTQADIDVMITICKNGNVMTMQPTLLFVGRTRQDLGGQRTMKLDHQNWRRR
jgi:hypothetical protein